MADDGPKLSCLPRHLPHALFCSLPALKRLFKRLQSAEPLPFELAVLKGTNAPQSFESALKFMAGLAAPTDGLLDDFRGQLVPVQFSKSLVLLLVHFADPPEFSIEDL